eukprot:TRINITY_DN215_c0_g1_i1.p1 TRINITY_DN215_c0_g1~~TRINITY_DN215_c0_g1_i1.p1  ORF type:complete len:307 (+),score=63.61 TRINITY_DN215_c0_g1_i1:179-1099(+)
MQEDTTDEQINRVKNMRLNILCIFLSCLARMVFMFYFFEQISFIISLFISIFGILSSMKKQKTCLSIYGYLTLIQAIGVYCFVIYYGMKNPQPLWMYGLYSLFIVVLSIGASSSFSLRNQIRHYESIYGDIRRHNHNKKRSSNSIVNKVNNENEMNNYPYTILDMEELNNNNSINNSSNNIYNHSNNNNININNNNAHNFVSNNNNTSTNINSFIIPQHMIPNVYSDKFINNNNGNINTNNNMMNLHSNNVVQQINSPPPQFHVYFPQQFPTSQSPVTYAKSPQHIAPQIITHQRNVPRRNVVYQI